MKQLHNLKLVTIICETVLKDKIIQDLKHYGATGYTLTMVSGEGSRGLSADEIPGEKIKFECVVSESVSKKIIEHVSDQYFNDFSMICFISDVQVLRGNKYILN